MLRAPVRLIKELEIDLAGVKTAGQLKKRLVEAAGRSWAGHTPEACRLVVGEGK